MTGITAEISTNPYPGLRAFEYTENHLFFGREGQAKDVAQRLQKNHFVAVVGTSGSGKSSLVRAGLLPILYGGRMFDFGSRWRIALMRPEETPIRNLAQALTYPINFGADQMLSAESQLPQERDKTQIGIVEAMLHRSGVGLLDYLNSGEVAPDENLLIVVDQFEELFRFKEKSNSADSDEAVAFVKLLLEATRDKEKRVYVIITMRSDFLGDCAEFRDLPQAINDGQYLIPRLTREQLRSIIESPARVYDAEVSPPLVNRLLNDLEDDQNQSPDLRDRLMRDRLPVLQHALMRTWKVWADQNTPNTPLNIEHYENIGGMAKALSNHADEAYQELSDEQKPIAEKMFKCLTETDSENRETRRPACISEIADVAGVEPKVIYPLVEVFRRSGRTFLMPPPNIELTEDTKIDISHESLIRNWDSLKKWVKREAEDAWQYRRLTEDALLYEEFCRDENSLLRGRALADAAQWFENFVPNIVWAERYYVFTEDERLRLAEIRRNNPSAEEAERREIVGHRLDEIRTFLKESNLVEERELAAERRNIRVFRTLTMAFAIMFLVSSGLAYTAYKYYQDAQKQLKENNLINKNLLKEKEDKQSYIERLEVTKAGLEETEKGLLKSESDLKQALLETEESEKQLESSLKKQKQLTLEADEAKEVAENNAERRRNAELQKQEALNKLQVSFNNLEAAKKEVELAKDEAVKNAQKEKAIANRERINRFGLTAMEKGSFDEAVNSFGTLRSEYAELEKNVEALEKEAAAGNDSARDELSKIDKGEIAEGIWWANHNLGTSFWKNGQPLQAQTAYVEALKKLGEKLGTEIILPHSKIARQEEQIPVRFVVASFRQTSDRDENNRKLATYQKFGQYFHDQARKTKDPDQSKKFNENAEAVYKRLLALAGERSKERITYEAELRLELADIYADLNKYSEAVVEYEAAWTIYKNADKDAFEVELLKKISQMELRQNKFPEAAARINLILATREKELSPDDPEIADIYQNLADIYSQHRIEILNKLQDPKPSENKDSKASASSTEKKQQTVEEKQVVRLASVYAQIVASVRKINASKNKTAMDEDDFQFYWFEPYEDLARAYIELGKCPQAYLILDKAEKRAGDMFAKRELSRDDYSYTLLQTARIYERIKKDDQAERFYDKFINLPEESNLTNSLEEISGETGYFTAANFYVKRQKYDLAIKRYERYLKLLKNENLDERYQDYALLQISIAHEKIASVLEMQGNRTAALAEYQKALDYVETKTLPLKLKNFAKADILVRQANFYYNTIKEKSKAQNIYQEAQKILEKPEYSKTPSSNYVRSLIKIGDIEREEEDFNGAARSYSKAKAVLEAYKSLPPSIASSGDYFYPSNLQRLPIISYYEDYLSILNLLKQLGKSNESQLLQEINQTEADLKKAKKLEDKSEVENILICPENKLQKAVQTQL